MSWEAAAMGAQAAVNVVGSALGAAGTRSANRHNRKLARDQMLFNKQEAEISRGWQERMSNTSYQRAMADMEKAGLNPILAYNQGGASSPGVGSATAGGMATMQNEMQGVAGAVSGSASSALDAKLKIQELKNMKDTGENIRHNTVKARSETAVNNTSVLNLEEQNRIFKANAAKGEFDVRMQNPREVRDWMNSIMSIFRR